MRLGIDIDDTITDTYEVLFNYAQRYNVEELHKSANINKEACTTHHYTSHMHNWNDEERETFWKKYYLEILSKVRLKTFAKEYLLKLAENNEIYLITARFDNENEDARKVTEEWLKQNGIKYNKLILDAEEKGKVAKENKIDVFIDDSFDNCKNVSREGIRTYIMDSRTNRALDESKENFMRVYSWAHLYQQLNLN